MTKRVLLKPGREKSLRRRHPWVFSGAVAEVAGAPASGETVAVCAADGSFLAHGAYSPCSQMRVRVWSFEAAQRIDAAFVAARVAAALEYRRATLGAAALEVARLVHGESDGLPGVIVDRYGEVAVLQLGSAGAEYWRAAIVDALVEATAVRWVFERSDVEVRSLEGLAPRVGPLYGGEPPPAIAIEEGAARYLVDFRRGHKSGFYLDQRDNRARLRERVAGREVLDAFCYTGGFALAALAGGAARVSALESSADALAGARANARASGFPDDRVEWLEEDVFAGLRRLATAGRRFDTIVLDPPRFAPGAQHVTRAARAYKDVNLWALRLLRPGGVLFTFSCSGAVDAKLFQSIVAGAAVDAGVVARIVRRLGASADHPVALAFPEGAYLKGLEIVVE